MSYWADKVAVITGGSGGLGKALAAAFAQRGLRVVLAARNIELLEAAAAPLRSSGRRVLTIAADITSQDDVDRLFRRTIEEFGRLDVLVNSAGRSARGQVIETTPEEFVALMDLNFIAAVRCVRAAVPHLMQTQGHLVNVGSLSGKSASRYVGAYPASKFALAAYTQQLRLELSPRGLHVLLVSPGPIARENAEQRYSDQVAGLPERAKKPGAGVKLRAVRPEKLSEAIVRACERRRPEVVYPPYMRILVALGQLSPRLGDWIVRRLT
jgi:short-subunit dehydrogenase